MNTPPNSQRKFRVGLAGGIASGKTAVGDMFIARGVRVVDADLVAREVTAPGQPGLAAIVETFGPQILQDDDQLDRHRLRQRIFADAGARNQLETILHPLIRTRILEQADADGGAYQIIAVPLLVETGFNALVDRVLVVDCPAELQLERLISRDGETDASARAILDAQVNREDRLAIADDVITNTGSLAELEPAVEHLHRKYLLLSAQATQSAD
jgi:dephospho-CoA kinase